MFLLQSAITLLGDWYCANKCAEGKAFPIIEVYLNLPRKQAGCPGFTRPVVLLAIVIGMFALKVCQLFWELVSGCSVSVIFYSSLCAGWLMFPVNRVSKRVKLPLVLILMPRDSRFFENVESSKVMELAFRL